MFDWLQRQFRRDVITTEAALALLEKFAPHERIEILKAISPRLPDRISGEDLHCILKMMPLFDKKSAVKHLSPRLKRPVEPDNMKQIINDIPQFDRKDVLKLLTSAQK